MNTNIIKFSFKNLILIFIACFIVSCERDEAELEPATYPTTPEVFIDGFSAGLNYGAFGGSLPTAFQVDEETTYGNTKSSMRFEVPDVNDPRGAYAGGVFFTSVGRDLTEYDALTFWAKASKAANIDLIGFGNDFEIGKYQASIAGVPVNTNWKKYVIPIPDPSLLKNEKGMFFYSEGAENEKGYTFWIDEVKFEKLGTIAHPKFSIMKGEDVNVSAENGQTFQVKDLSFSANLPTGIDQTVNISPNYVEFVSSAPGVATVNNQGLVTVIGAGRSVITAKSSSGNAAGSLIVNSIGEAIKPPVSAPVPTRPAADVISMFSNAYTNVNIDTWNTRWQFSTAEEQFLDIKGDNLIRYRNLNFVGIEFTSTKINASAMTHFHIDLWTPDNTNLPKALKILLVDFGANGQFGGGDDSSHELAFTKPALQTGEWVSLDIPLTNFTGLTNRRNLAQLVLSGDIPNLFIDNVYFYKAPAPPSMPTSAAPIPNRAPSNVISIFSDTYQNVPGSDFNPNWGQATAVSQVAIAGNNTLRYGGLNYQGLALGSPVNVSSMGFLHLDFWSSNSSNLNVFLISPGPKETPYKLTVPTNGWTSVDIPLSAFAGVNLSEVFQFKFDGNGDIFIDNIYFYKNATTPIVPTNAAPVPTHEASNVISIFSDSYTNVSGSDLNPNWGQATVVSEVSIGGNKTLKYAGLNYQGLQFGSPQNVSSMGFLHIDFYSGNSTNLSVFLISPGPKETPFKLTVPTNGWSSIDIPLSSFSGVNLSEAFQLKFEGNGEIYLDNIYFRK